jgi:hypothetical protein
LFLCQKGKIIEENQEHFVSKTDEICTGFYKILNIYGNEELCKTEYKTANELAKQELI